MNSIEKFQNFINSTPIALVYFSSSTCSACTALKPKIASLIKDYDDRMSMLEIKASEDVYLTSQLNIFTFPSILLYIDGKEVLRESKYISVLEFKEKLHRYYTLYT